MPIDEIMQCIDNANSCDSGGRELVGMEDFPLDEHIALTINHVILGSFEDGIKSDIKNCRVIADISDKL